jgi:hypothetical protein
MKMSPIKKENKNIKSSNLAVKPIRYFQPAQDACHTSEKSDPFHLNGLENFG